MCTMLSAVLGIGSMGTALARALLKARRDAAEPARVLSGTDHQPGRSLSRKMELF